MSAPSPLIVLPSPVLAPSPRLVSSLIPPSSSLRDELAMLKLSKTLKDASIMPRIQIGGLSSSGGGGEERKITSSILIPGPSTLIPGPSIPFTLSKDTKIVIATTTPTPSVIVGPSSTPSSSPGSSYPSLSSPGTHQSIKYGEKPTSPKFILGPIYKVNLDRVLVWQVSFDGIDHIEMSYGQHGGAIQTTKTKVEVKGGKTMQQQALQECNHLYDKKYREGYQPPGDPTSAHTKPMKGDLYSEGKIKRWPVAVQAKLDGVRFLIQNNGENITMRTTGNKYYNTFPHLFEELKELFKYLPAFSTLDGEMYCHGMSINDIVSIVKTVKTIHKDILKLKFHIFDIIYSENPPYEIRSEVLRLGYQRYLDDLKEEKKEAKYTVLLPNYLAHNHEQLMAYCTEFEKQDYEGIMIKRLALGETSGVEYERSRYRDGKHTNIYKFKRFMDEEALVINVKAASGREVNAAMLIVQDKRGNVIEVRPATTFSIREEWLKNPLLIVGQYVTIKFQELTPDGVPRFPVVKTIRPQDI